MRPLAFRTAIAIATTLLWTVVVAQPVSAGGAPALRVCTTGDYTPINNQLRSGKPLSDDVSALNKEIISGMAKLPSYQGPSLTRLTDLPEHIADQYQPGNTVEPGGYSSTSTITTGATMISSARPTAQAQPRKSMKNSLSLVRRLIGTSPSTCAWPSRPRS